MQGIDPGTVSILDRFLSPEVLLDIGILVGHEIGVD